LGNLAAVCFFAAGCLFGAVSFMDFMVFLGVLGNVVLTFHFLLVRFTLTQGIFGTDPFHH
jgi:hypothetical protein